MQASSIGSLMEIAEKDKNILYLTGDSGEGGLHTQFVRNFPEQSFEFGIAEQNMAGVASGLALSGKIPFIYTAAPFLCYRAFEFLRDDICLQNANVKLIATGSGLSVSMLGPTHHTTEDISILRVLPNLKILSPATPIQAGSAIKAAYKHNGPVYIRLDMNKGHECFDDSYIFNLGENDVISHGDDVAIFSTGSILEEVIKAKDILKENNISPTIINVATIKPFDKNLVIDQAHKVKTFCTVEEHNIIGGLSSIISDILIENNLNVKLIKIGLNDCFAKGYSTLPQIRRENFLDSVSIANKIIEAKN